MYEIMYRDDGFEARFFYAHGQLMAESVIEAELIA